MGKHGPKRKPEELRKLEGYPGKQAKRFDDVPKAMGPLHKPANLSEYASQAWDIVTGSMPPSLYAACDSFLLAAYCRAADLNQQADDGIRELGAVVLGQNGAPYQNPWISVQNKSAQLLATLGTRLGLDPTARSSLRLPSGEKPASKFGDLIPITGRKGSSPSSSD